MQAYKAFNILAVDDEIEVLNSIREILTASPECILETVRSGKDALKLIQNSPKKYSVILVDYLMPDMNGAETTKEILKINPDLLIAMHSGDSSREALKESLLAGAVDFFEKGLPANELKQKIKAFCQKYEESIKSLEDEDVSSNEEIIRSTGMFGVSEELSIVAKNIIRAAQVDTPILILGETGTGKEVVAKAIHKLSKRNNFNFIPVNMSAITTELFESQMFGHLKGSFTGAISNSIGHFKAANCGTIFLDEIGEMPLENQAKLLRVLQEKEVQAVGAIKPEKINSRVVAATNINIEDAVHTGRFRLDLFYRLNIFPIEIPPLRERSSDIRSLVIHFKKKYRGDNKTILMEVIHKFEKYKWPGNIRELESEVQKLVEIIPDQKITLKHLDSKFFEEKNLNITDITKLSYDEFKQHQKQLEVDYINAQFKRFKSTREAASDGFKIPESTLRGRLQALNLKI
jgi:two-component system nitrogen regulation response regulator NtrX